MVKIQILSDLHIESWGKLSPEDYQTDADVIVIAGDIWNTPHRHLSGANLLFLKCSNIVTVAGNHEHYQSQISIKSGIKEIKELSGNFPRVKFLENDTFVYKDKVRFIGATLWTDFELNGDRSEAKDYALRGMMDYVRIRGEKYYDLHPSELEQIHHDSRDYIENQLKEQFNGKTVVVTHHLPSGKLIHPKYANSVLNPAFASDCEYLMDYGVDLWICGHTHDSIDSVIKNTRVICNPLGYRFRDNTAENKDFNPKLVVEI